MARGQAYRRHQTQRAVARAEHLVYVVWAFRDSAYAEELVRMHSIDRTHGHPWRYAGHRPRDQRRADDARDQLTTPEEN